MADYPAVPDAPDVSGLGPMPGAAVAFLWLMGAGEGREFAFDLETLERVDHYAVQVFGCLGGSAANPVVVAAVSAVHGRVGLAIRHKRARAEREASARASLQGGPAPGSGGARVLAPVGPSTRPPGGVGVALPRAAGAADGGGGQWSF